MSTLAPRPGNGRNSKQKLTVIPEAEREVKYRFHVVVCGKGASEFCMQACASDLAQELLAKVMGDEAKRKGSQDSISEEAPVADSPKEQVLPKTTSGRTTTTSTSADEHNVMFLPVGEQANVLARIRFQTCEKFSDSLPQPKDRQQATGTVIVLYMPKPTADAEEAAKAATRDWMSRLAEIGFLKPKLRPYVAAMSYGLEEEAEKVVMEFVTNAKVAVTPIFTEQADEGGVIESLQTLVDKAVAAGDKLRRTGSLLSRQASRADEGGASSSCCAVS